MTGDTMTSASNYLHNLSFLMKNRTIEQAIEIYFQRIKDAEEVFFNKFSSTFHDRVCPVCGNENKHDLELFHASYGVSECRSCLTKYVNPCPSLDALTYYYNDCECNSLFGKHLRSRHRTGNVILSERAEFVLNLINEHFKSKQSIRVLEVGCNSGAFLSELKDAANASNIDMEISYYGIDIDRQAIANNVDVDICLEASSAEDFADSSLRKFDLILHFELIEHLQDPFNFMKSIRNLMSEGGLHHFHTPNADGFDNKALGYNDFRPIAHGIFPPMHLQAFSPSNITHFSLRAGFRLVQVDTPGNFDVDIVRTFLDRADPVFGLVREMPEKYLAVFQQWLKILGASSHMRVTLSI